MNDKITTSADYEAVKTRVRLWPRIKFLLFAFLLMLLAVPIVELFWVEHSALSLNHPVQRSFVKFGHLAAFLPEVKLSPNSFEQTYIVEKRFGFDNYVTSLQRLSRAEKSERQGKKGHDLSFLRMSLQQHSSQFECKALRELSWHLRGWHLSAQRGFQVKAQELTLRRPYDRVRVVVLQRNQTIVGQRIQLQKGNFLVNIELHGAWCRDAETLESLFGKKFERFIKTKL